MDVLADVMVALVAVLHVWFLVLEMVLWQKPLGRRTFGTDAEFAERSAALAANQGLYNGFLAAGLVWSLFAADDLARPLALFFLGCVVVAGLYGAGTVNRRILVIQALPAALGLVLVLASG
jgi:putative membrane protein